MMIQQTVRNRKILKLGLIVPPPVPLGTSGSSLAPFSTVSCNILNFLPLEVDHLQILLQSFAPRLLGRPVLCLPSAAVQDIATFAAR